MTGVAPINRSKFYQSNQDFSIREMRNTGTIQAPKDINQSYSNTRPYLHNKQKSMAHFSQGIYSNTNIKKIDVVTCKFELCLIHIFSRKCSDFSLGLWRLYQ